MVVRRELCCRWWLDRVGGGGHGVWGRNFVGRDLRRKARARQCFCPKKAARAIYEKVAGTPRVAGYLALSGQKVWGR